MRTKYTNKNRNDLNDLIASCNKLIVIMTSIMTILFIALIDLISDMPVSHVHANIATIEAIPIIEEEFIVEETVIVENEIISSGERTIEINVLENKGPELRMEIDDKTLEVLTRVTEAEVTGSNYSYNGKELTYDELLKSKIRVAQVFMNRVEDSKSFSYINDLYESLTYENASSTFKNGRYYEVDITDITKEAVRLALLKETPDYTDGALYFASGTTTSKYGDLIFVDDVGHAFFK